jgi:hypothetical protein
VATTPRRRDGVKEAGEEARQEVRDWLEQTAREGARRILTETLEEEVETYLGRGRYERPQEEVVCRGAEPSFATAYFFTSYSASMTLSSAEPAPPPEEVPGAPPSSPTGDPPATPAPTFS